MSRSVSRRTFIKQTLLWSGALSLPLWTGCFNDHNHPFEGAIAPEFFNPESDKKKYGIGFLDQRHNKITHIPTEFLGHSVLPHPLKKNHVVMFGQRPGTLSCEADLSRGKVVKVFRCKEGRGFYGHGTFSADGKTLFATETVDATGEGIISIWDSENYTFLDDMTSHGVGPHDMTLIDNGKVLFIANGGVNLKPYSNEAITEDEMNPSLSFVDLSSGSLLDKVILNDKTLSLRHLTLGPKNSYAVGIKQYVKKGDLSPSLYIKTLSGKAVLIDSPDALVKKMAGHTFSLCINPTTNTLGCVSPQANLASFWSMDNGELINTFDLPKPEGIVCSKDKQHFIISSKAGILYRCDNQTLKPQIFNVRKTPGLNWGHMNSIYKLKNKA